MLDYEDALGFFTSAMYPTLFTQKNIIRVVLCPASNISNFEPRGFLVMTTAWKAHTLDSIAD
jgi:hypothetical protein